MVAVVGLVLIAVGSTENQEPLTLAGIVVTLVGSTLMFAAVIALGVRWGIQLSDYARYQRRN